ncbi:hypothetical protein GCM10020367_11800 [Streptomyces sannanensis]|uniref:DUF3618 domain-containing protein n=1 Tax=Streptomyces sannanensis TaxID=285536 RepID=A0ABP6S6X7_9ACTN
MSTDPDHAVVVDELAELRRCLEVGLARIDGHLALAAQRCDQTERDLADLAARVAALEHGRWPLPAVTVLASVGAVCLGVWQALGR